MLSFFVIAAGVRDITLRDEEWRPGMNASTKCTMLFSVLALAGAAHAQIAFDAPSSTVVGSQPSGVAIADLNGDGFADMAATSDGPDKVSIFLGDGMGGFTPGQIILTGANSGAGSLVASDFDGDGDVDLAVALQNSNSVRVLSNTAGTFTPGGSFATGTNPRGLTAGDHNADGAVDLVVANRDSNNATVLTNLGGLTFSSNTVATGPDPRGAAWYDADMDGDLDLAVGNNDNDTLSLFTNNAGVFTANGTVVVAGGNSPDGITAADADQDGDTDLLVSAGGFVVVMFNDAGAIGTQSLVATGGIDSGAIITGDFDCDGFIDIAVANQDSNNASVIPGAGAGTFGAPVIIPAGLRPDAIATGDLNGDGSPDLVVANSDGSDVTVALNSDSCDGGGPGGPCNGDANGDGVVDLADLNLVLSNFGNTCN